MPAMVAFEAGHVLPDGATTHGHLARVQLLFEFLVDHDESVDQTSDRVRAALGALPACHRDADTMPI